MNEHLVPKMINFCVVKLSNSLAITRVSRLDLDHFKSQSDSPRLNQRLPRLSLNRKYLAPMGGVLGALLASSCCILPLLLVMLGVGGSWIGSLSELNIYQPYFIVFAGLCLSAGFWQVYKRPVQKSDSVPECSGANSRIYTKAILWGATLLVVVNATITWWAPILY